MPKRARREEEKEDTSQSNQTTIPPQVSSIVTLNVGGKLYMTTIGTLTSPVKGLFSRMFSSESVMTGPPVVDMYGNIFIDRHSEAFGVILEYLRTGTAVVPEGVSREQAKLELDYFFNNPPQPVTCGMMAFMKARPYHVLMRIVKNIVLEATRDFNNCNAKRDVGGELFRCFQSGYDERDNMVSVSKEYSEIYYNLSVSDMSDRYHYMMNNDARELVGIWLAYEGKNVGFTLEDIINCVGILFHTTDPSVYVHQKYKKTLDKSLITYMRIGGCYDDYPWFINELIETQTKEKAARSKHAS